MQQTAMKVLIGRDRVAHLLLMRLAETFVIWLSNDQEFWDTIEQGPRSLGAIGLQQVSHPQFSFSPRPSKFGFARCSCFSLCNFLIFLLHQNLMNASPNCGGAVCVGLAFPDTGFFILQILVKDYTPINWRCYSPC
jgi:hypothetical protein